MKIHCTPDLSIVIATSGREKCIVRTIDGLRAQNIRDRLEIIIVVSTVESGALNGIDMGCFCRVKVIEVKPMTPRSEARACGLMNASALVVAFIEDHAYPDVGWAEAVLHAHTACRAAVGYQILNANPESSISWANLFLLYGPWVERVTPIGHEMLPSENISYKREVLMQYGEGLCTFFENDYTLHHDLLKKGFLLHFEPTARLYHRNVDSLPASASYNLLNGRIFATARSCGWSIYRRLAYAGGFFLIPFVRAPRIFSDVSRTGRNELIPRIIPALMIGLVMGALGEMAGYLFRNGDKEQLT